MKLSAAICENGFMQTLEYLTTDDTGDKSIFPSGQVKLDEVFRGLAFQRTG
jgi:hypothetical protein